MIKLLKSIQTVFVILFILVNVYLLLFNWNVFTVSLDINYGFGTFLAPPIIIMMVFSLVTIALIWFTDYTKDLRSEINLLKKDEALNNLKNKPHTDSNVEIKTMLSSLQEQMMALNDSINQEKEDHISIS